MQARCKKNSWLRHEFSNFLISLMSPLIILRLGFFFGNNNKTIQSTKIKFPHYSIEDIKFRFIHNGKAQKDDTLIFIYLISIVIKNGMDILGVSLPEKM